MMFVQVCSGFKEFGKSPHDKMSFNVLLADNKALQHWLRAMYSATVEFSAISACSLLEQ
jgi:hypothetical protein